MPRRQANCPACAAPVEFNCRTSLVAVCSNCHSVVARGDKKLEDHGRISDLVDTQSPLKLGLRGRFRTTPFFIVGHAQYKHSQGGVWDEWFAAFPNGKWGWIAEAQGRFYVTFEAKVRAEDLPSLQEIRDGQTIKLEDQDYTVAEVGIGQLAGAEGEMPISITPNAELPFVDLYGPEGRFATLDYGSESVSCYVGWEVGIAALGIKDLTPAVTKPKQVSALKVGCPQCGGMLELRAPDETQRVVCQFCSSLLNCDKGNLNYLKSLKSKVKPLIELGTKGVLHGVEFTVIGFFQRSVTFDIKYTWTEYLLYEPKTGFRWLEHSDAHWSFIEPVSPSKVRDEGKIARHDGRTYKLFQEAMARVEYVLGECYWNVEVGEAVLCRDFVCPPYSLSFERSNTSARVDRKNGVQLGETTISLATYLPHADVEAAFGVKALPRGWVIAPNQPCPMSNEIYLQWALFLVAFCLLYFIANLINLQPDGWLLWWMVVLVSLIPIIGSFINSAFDQRRWAESEFGP